jgi:hypothetical protein
MFISRGGKIRGANSTDMRNERCIPNTNQKTQRDDTTWNTETQIVRIDL